MTLISGVFSSPATRQRHSARTCHPIIIILLSKIAICKFRTDRILRSFSLSDAESKDNNSVLLIIKVSENNTNTDNNSYDDDDDDDDT